MNRIVVFVSLLLAVAGCMSTSSRPPEMLAAGGVVYPTQAREQKIEGYVKVIYDVTIDGTVANARVVEADPPGVFDAAALSAVNTWRFNPAVANDKIVPAQGVVSRVKFKLGESEDYVR